jgi:hypothetical protein
MNKLEKTLAELRNHESGDILVLDAATSDIF